MEQRKRPIRYGLFAAGLVLAMLSFLIYLGNALAMEGANQGIADFGIYGIIGGCVVAGLGILAGPVMALRFDLLAYGVVGGVAGAGGGWLLGSLLFPGGNWNLDCMLAVCFCPIGMWLGLLAGPREPVQSQEPSLPSHSQ